MPEPNLIKVKTQVFIYLKMEYIRVSMVHGIVLGDMLNFLLAILIIEILFHIHWLITIIVVPFME